MAPERHRASILIVRYVSMPNKELRTGSFVVHATRGVIRDRTMRRRMMLVLLALALLMIVAGSTFLAATLDPREHAVRFILFWLACAWFTISALLLALFDVLMVRREARALQKQLQHQYSRGDRVDPDRSDDKPGA